MVLVAILGFFEGISEVFELGGRAEVAVEVGVDDGEVGVLLVVVEDAIVVIEAVIPQRH